MHTIDRSINLAINLNKNRFNHKHCHVFYCLQQPCGEFLTVIYCYDKQIKGIIARNRSMHTIVARRKRTLHWSALQTHEH